MCEEDRPAADEDEPVAEVAAVGDEAEAWLRARAEREGHEPGS